AMGNLIVRQRIPPFIITLGGLLVFKGLFWLVINNHTIPVVTGGRTNLYALLTTYYLPAWAGYAVAALVISGLVFAHLRARASRQQRGFPIEVGELTFLRLFVCAQVILL